MKPLENGHSTRECLVHQFAGQFPRSASIRLKFGADVSRSQLGQILHSHAVKAGSVLVTEEKSSGVPVKNDDGFGRVFDERTEASFTGLQRRSAFVNPLFQGS